MNNEFIVQDTIDGILSSEEPVSGGLIPANQVMGGVSACDDSEPANLYGRLTVPGYRYLYEKDYEMLDNKPSINDVELIKNKNFSELGLVPMSNSELESLLS